MNQIVGNSVPCKIGRKTFFVSYVSVGEWGVYEELTKLDTTQAVLQLIYYSLRRGGNRITRWGIRRLGKRPELLPLMETICKLSIPDLKAKTAAGLDPAEAMRNEKTVYRLLSRMHGWSPLQINDMSPAQVFIYLTGGKDGTGIEKMDGAEYRSFRANRGLN